MGNCLAGSNPAPSARAFCFPELAALDGEVAVPYSPQSATAGLNSHPRPDLVGSGRRRTALKTWPCATRTCELRQARKGAAVSRLSRVPQVSLVRVGPAGTAGRGRVKGGCAATELCL